MGTSDEPDFSIDELIRIHQGAIRSFLRAILPGVGDVSDVLQDVNMVLWKKSADFTPGTNFKAWAFAVARFVAMDAQKKYKRNSWIVFSGDTVDAIADDYAGADSGDGGREAELDALERCIAKLRKEDLNLLECRYMSKTKLEEHADLVKRSVGALKVRLHKLRSNLRLCIEQRLAKHYKK